MAAPSPLAELSERIVEIEPNRMERVDWLVERLYAELNEDDSEVA